MVVAQPAAGVTAAERQQQEVEVTATAAPPGPVAAGVAAGVVEAVVEAARPAPAQAAEVRAASVSTRLRTSDDRRR